jgi:hypothetical protein
VPAPKVRVEGLQAVYRGLAAIDRDAYKELRLSLIAAAEPVAASARDKISRYQGASLGTIKPRASVRGAFVTQRAKKVTGKRPDFGALQMTRGMIPALDEHEDEIHAAAEAVQDLLIARHGF